MFFEKERIFQDAQPDPGFLLEGREEILGQILRLLLDGRMGRRIEAQPLVNTTHAVNDFFQLVKLHGSGLSPIG